MNKKLEDMPKQELEIITDHGPCCKITNGYLNFEINERRARGFFIKQMVTCESVETQFGHVAVCLNPDGFYKCHGDIELEVDE